MNRVLNFILFRNIFIAGCAVALFYSTLLLNDLPTDFSASAFFLFCSTCLYYNFHRFTHRINFSSITSFRKSVAVIRITFPQMILYLACFSGMLFSLVNMSTTVMMVFIIMGLISMSYSIPVIPGKDRRYRLRDFLHLKLPYLSVTWAVLTVCIPLADREVGIFNSQVMLQVFDRALFIYTLCIPFEIRDLDKERYWQGRTLPVVFGQRSTKMVGYFMVFLNIVVNHIMIDMYSFPERVIALDATAVLAFFWIRYSRPSSSPYYYKFYVDGTMFLHLLFVFLATASS